MLNVIIVAVITITAIWVYLDASKHKIGKVPDDKGLFNMPAGGWGCVTLGLWIIAFPAYLIKRSDLIEKAKESPIEVKGRAFKAIVLFIIGGLWTFIMLANNAPSPSFNLPDCDVPPVKMILEKSINGMPLMKETGAKFVSVKDVVVQGFNQATQIRSCSAALMTTEKEYIVKYSVKWLDQNKGSFGVNSQLYNAPSSSFNLPDCDFSLVKDALEKSVNGMPLMKETGAKVVSVKDVVAQGFNQATQIRSCSAALMTTEKEYIVKYSVKWIDQDKGNFDVNLQLYNK